MTGVKWYFDLATGEVSTEKKREWINRLGPYDTQSEALHALETVRRRNARADAEEEADDSWGYTR